MYNPVPTYKPMLYTPININKLMPELNNDDSTLASILTIIIHIY